jgi:NAD(P)-dependent dehydrogenase (short-subunit alcohol dehydrogenase family)
MKTVLVTGGSIGIGLALVKAYLKEGFKVINMAPFTPKENITGDYHYVHADLRKVNQLKDFFDQAYAHAKQIDILIHNAAAYGDNTFLDLTQDALDDVLAVNLKAPIFLSQYFTKQYYGKTGRIIIISSTRAMMSEKDTIPYTVTKGALNALTHSLAITLQEHYITVNAIAPGWINSKDEPIKDHDHFFHPSNRVGTTSDIVKACMYLSDPENSFINGEVITIDGGVSKKMIYPD